MASSRPRFGSGGPAGRWVSGDLNERESPLAGAVPPGPQRWAEVVSTRVVYVHPR